MTVSDKNLITILGPTASGKTSLAVAVARELQGEIISADSRQVYRGMDIGTGKDMHEYTVNGISIPVHLVDIADPGEEYNVFRFKNDFLKVYNDIISKKRLPILCGGTGMYLSSILQKYDLPDAVMDTEKLSELEKLTDPELENILRSSRNPHNTTDLLDRKRLIRAVYIETTGKHTVALPDFAGTPVFGIRVEREKLMKRITERLDQRINSGMIGEVKDLLASGITPEQLKFYGLEYRFITRYIEGEISFNEMFKELNIAIRQFAKRQMTWFRRMERNGVKIVWIDVELPLGEKVKIVTT